LLGCVVDAPDHVGRGIERASGEFTIVERSRIVGGEGVGFGGDGESTGGRDIKDVDVLAESGETVVGLEVVHFIALTVVDERSWSLLGARDGEEG